MELSNLIMPLAGGMVIGLSAILLMLLNGRIAGISGILSAALRMEKGLGWRALFIVGLLLSGILAALFWPAAPRAEAVALPLLLSSGFLVGLGTVYGGGCTSGHGICGIGRLSRRSIVATVVFMASGVTSAVWFH